MTPTSSPDRNDTGRIRWYADSENIVRYAGLISEPGFTAFQIFEPDFGGEEMILASQLPGQESCRFYDASPDKLKAEAERWLSEFISSLGASFPDEPASEFSDEDDEPGPEPDWRFEWEMIARDGDGNAVLKHKSTGGRYRIIPEEDL